MNFKKRFFNSIIIVLSLIIECNFYSEILAEKQNKIIDEYCQIVVDDDLKIKTLFINGTFTNAYEQLLSKISAEEFILSKQIKTPDIEYFSSIYHFLKKQIYNQKNYLNNQKIGFDDYFIFIIQIIFLTVIIYLAVFKVVWLQKPTLDFLNFSNNNKSIDDNVVKKVVKKIYKIFCLKQFIEKYGFEKHFIRDMKGGMIEKDADFDEDKEDKKDKEDNIKKNELDQHPINENIDNNHLIDDEAEEKKMDRILNKQKENNNYFIDDINAQKKSQNFTICRSKKINIENETFNLSDDNHGDKKNDTFPEPNESKNENESENSNNYEQLISTDAINKTNDFNNLKNPEQNSIQKISIEINDIISKYEICKKENIININIDDFSFYCAFEEKIIPCILKILNLNDDFALGKFNEDAKEYQKKTISKLNNNKKEIIEPIIIDSVIGYIIKKIRDNAFSKIELFTNKLSENKVFKNKNKIIRKKYKNFCKKNLKQIEKLFLSCNLEDIDCFCQEVKNKLTSSDLDENIKKILNIYISFFKNEKKKFNLVVLEKNEEKTIINIKIILKNDDSKTANPFNEASFDKINYFALIFFKNFLQKNTFTNKFTNKLINLIKECFIFTDNYNNNNYDNDSDIQIKHQFFTDNYNNNNYDNDSDIQIKHQLSLEKKIKKKNDNVNGNVIKIKTSTLFKRSKEKKAIIYKKKFFENDYNIITNNSDLNSDIQKRQLFFEENVNGNTIYKKKKINKVKKVILKNDYNIITNDSNINSNLLNNKCPSDSRVNKNFLDKKLKFQKILENAIKQFKNYKKNEISETEIDSFNRNFLLENLYLKIKKIKKNTNLSSVVIFLTISFTIINSFLFSKYYDNLYNKILIRMANYDIFKIGNDFWVHRPYKFIIDDGFIYFQNDVFYYRLHKESTPKTFLYIFYDFILLFFSIYFSCSYLVGKKLLLPLLIIKIYQFFSYLIYKILHDRQYTKNLYYQLINFIIPNYYYLTTNKIKIFNYHILAIFTCLLSYLLILFLAKTKNNNFIFTLKQNNDENDDDELLNLIVKKKDEEIINTKLKLENQKNYTFIEEKEI